MIEGNKIIRASAGTGKTYALATRFIRLMVFDKVAPERIVALTFSRAAAQEIYMAILKRLWQAAASDEGAVKEKENLLERLPKETVEAILKLPIDWSKEHFAGMLRAVTDTQHSGSIATLDSFIIRMVKNFPPDTGNAAAVLDEQGEREAMEAATRRLLGDSGDEAGIMAAFREIKEGTMPRTCREAVQRILREEHWSDLVLDNKECTAWTEESMATALGLDKIGEKDEAELESLETLVTEKTAKNWLTKLTDKLKAAKEGEAPLKKMSGMALELAMAVIDHPKKPFAVHKKSNGELEECTYPPEVFEALHTELKRLTGLYLRKQAKVAAAKIRLAAIVDGQYDALARKQGKLTFRDFTDQANGNGGNNLNFADVQFRFDSMLDHWELDEFQDTSEVQWACLKPLVETAAGGDGGRTVMAVGDLKQSIYGWRGGNDRPFEEVHGWFNREDQKEDLDVSHRYGKNIAEFVNDVFGPKNLRDNALPEVKGSAAAETWLEKCWMKHEAEGDDYVKARRVNCGQDRKEAMMEALYGELAAIWAEHEAKKSTESVGVLVRKNEEGALTAEYLRRRGLPVVWEGMNNTSDVPAVQAVMHILRLAEHPEDEFAWKFVRVLTPAAEILFGGAADAKEVSRKTAQMMSELGLARMLKEFCGKLMQEEYGLDGLSKERLKTLVKMGVDYEGRKTIDYGMDGFARYVAGAKSREGAATGKSIRILSIHRSKGLTMDRVIVPLFAPGNGASICEPGQLEMLKGKNWVLPHIPKAAAMMNKETKLAWTRPGQARLLEALRTYYVAFTRSKKALYVLMPDEAGPLAFTDIVKNATGRGETYERGSVPEWKREEQQGREEPAKWEFEEAAEKIEKIWPSKLSLPTGGKRMAAALFGENYAEAAKKGIKKHAELAAIEWAEGEELAAMNEELREAFRKPEEGARVWRERSYEIFDGKQWETGQFDRVVFTGKGDARRAVIYDFKTGNTDKAAYAPQLERYKRALIKLTGLKDWQVETKTILVK